ncbi:hypothetical protein QBC38DRAFT_355589 [Podospora fimiseda]|uniref:Probable endonuclease LCL3 n=1 Tax=Podospora fimiseda TaxID=252190 RepID=A0AAN7H7E7_9PEZI|nr:hypothetical protein QBC38DRAFT_355589 [Podospora fimiseda]
MCLHKRVVYTCNHSAFLELCKPCPVEQSFIRGEVTTGCSQMWSHGFDAFRVGENCAQCAATIKKENDKLALIKEQLKLLKNKLQEIQQRVVDGDEKGKSSTNTAAAAEDHCSSSSNSTSDEDADNNQSSQGTATDTTDLSSSPTRASTWSVDRSPKTQRTSDTSLIQSSHHGRDDGDDEEKSEGEGDGEERMMTMEVRYHHARATTTTTTTMPWIRSNSDKDDGSNKNTKNKTESLKNGVIGHFSETENWIAPLVAVGATLGLWTVWQRYLRRIPTSAHIPPSYFHRRGLFGKVTSVGDGDGFHLYHTPGGRLAGWGWLRTVPSSKKELKGNTIPIRIAGVDAPEGAHFGRTAQPFATEAQNFLDSYILNRRVRAYIYRKDQYDRIVASVYVRKPPFFFPRKDVGLEILKAGLATTYEAKFGAEYGGAKKEENYKASEALAKQKGKGMWSLEKPVVSGIFFKTKAPTPEPLESPMAYKKRMKALEEQQAAAIAAVGGGTAKSSSTARTGSSVQPKVGSAASPTHKSTSERKR